MTALLFLLCPFVPNEAPSPGANQKQKTDWSEMNLKGRVKLIRESVYATIERNGKVQRSERKDSVVYLFNDKGNKIETRSYKPGGSLNAKYTYRYDYDRSLNWTRKIEFENEKPLFLWERAIEYF
jgi:hypothetical protein